MKNLVLGIALGTILGGCGVTPIYKATGQHNAQKYVFELEDTNELTATTTIIKANGTEVFNHTWKNLYKEPSCFKTAVASWQCDFVENLDGKKLKIVYVTKANLHSNATLYDLYLDDDFVTQIVTKAN